jgi:hypothetical protein
MNTTSCSGQPVPPVFITDGGDVNVFMDIHDSETEMEAVDVQDQVYNGYDSLGRLLQLSTVGDSVRVSLAEDQPTHAGELADKLRAFLAAIHDSAANDVSYDLPRLVLHFHRFAPKPTRSLWEALTGKQKKDR